MPTWDENSWGVDVVKLLVDITEVDCWDEKLSVGVERDFESIKPGTKISRIMVRKPISKMNTITDLFF